METKNKKIHLIRAISGQSRGKEFILNEDEITIDKRIVIVRKNKDFIIKSLSFNEIMINGEPFIEGILEDDDKIFTENSEYVYQVRDPLTDAKKRILAISGGAAFILFLLLLTIPILFPSNTIVRSIFKKPPLHHEQKINNQTRIDASAYDLTDMNDFVVASFESGSARGYHEYLKSPSTPEEIDEALAKARLRFQIAKVYAEDYSLGFGHLFWAVQEFKEIVKIFKNVSPPPPIVAEALENIDKYQQVLEQRKNHFILVAKIAAARGDIANEMDAIKNVLAILQVESGKDAQDYSKAQLQLLKLQKDLEKQKAKKQ